MRRPWVRYIAWGWLAFLVLAAVLVGLFKADPEAIDLGQRLEPPGWEHWLGTDELGRSLLVRLLFAARSSLWITLAATTLALILGAVLGIAAAWFGGWWDRVVNGAISTFWSIPFAIFAVLVLSIVGTRTGAIILVIAGVNWVSSARVFRAEALRLKHSTFLRSAKALGFPPAQLLFQHLFPNLRTTAITLAGFGAVETLTLESGLAFLGLSVPPPLPTWGGIMADGLAYLSTAWWIALFAALMVILTVASIRVLSGGSLLVLRQR